MSNNPGVGGNVISTPKGGGAVGGMGEKFSPDLFTGTGNFSVPIALPPGRNGFQPDVTIVYSTGNGSSTFGMGWGLSIPGVSRKTSKGIPVYDDKKDVFILSGAEDLVPVPDDTTPANAQRYKPRTEGLFARIDRYLDADNDYWKVWSKDGLISYYGTPESANTAIEYNDPAVSADPDYKSKVFQWMLSKTVDVFGNQIQYTYTRDSNDSTPLAVASSLRTWDMLNLSQIKYADYLDGEETKFLCSVKFIYEERPDPFSAYKSGYEMRTTKRCTKIEIYTHPEGEDVLTKTYHFIYLDQRVESGELTSDILPLNGASMLSQVKIQGHNGEESEWMPPLEFSYTQFEPKKRDFYPIGGRDLPPVSLAAKDYEMADMFGNGLPDIIQMNGVARYWKNIGNGKYDMPREMKNSPAGVELADPEVSIMDAQGDGKIDLVVMKQGLAGYFPLQHTGLWDRKSFQKYKQIPSFSLADPEVIQMDLDGDGITDVLRNGSSLECFFNDPDIGFYKTVRVEKKKLNGFPNVSFADPRIRTCDMSGDGMQDIVMINDGLVEYWPNMGHGKWGAKVSMRKSPRFPYRHDPARILIGDVDGDGTSDIIYVENNKITLWLNNNGNSWSDPITISGTPPVHSMASVRLADMLGSGTSGIVWSYDFDGTQRDRMFFFDFTGGLKPYLLHEMNNHMGAITRTEYKSSVDYYLEDQKKPETRWKTTLPFPVHVVSKVEVIDEISGGKLVTEYSYHHGYWDGGEREFRGFGRVEQKDTETFERFNETSLRAQRSNLANLQTLLSDTSFNQVENIHYTPPTLTKTWFHLGPVGDEFGDWQEVDFTEEYWSGDPQVLTRPQEMIGMIKALPRRARRDAYRTLRGSILRTELYALDDSELKDRPYTVSENLQGVRLEYSPMTNDQSTLIRTSSIVNRNSPDSNNKAGSGYIFFSHGLASRSTQWERGNDPMTQFSFTEDYDDYGIPQKQIGIAVPRGKSPIESNQGGDPYLCTYAQSEFVHKNDSTHYLIGRAIKASSFEIVNDGSTSVFKLRDQILKITAEETFPYADDYELVTFNLLTCNLTYYDGTAFTGLSHGVLGDYGVPVKTETLIMTDAQVEDIYGAVRPPYILADETPATPTWTSDYPTNFRTTVPENAGYKFHEAGSVYEEGYYCIADRKKFDFHDDPETAKGLVIEMKDPLDHVASVEYDTYKMLPVQVTDPAGMETIATYDYRVMQASEIMDPNLNHVAFAFSPLGFLFKSAVMGKEGDDEGDTLEDPGTFMEYDFFAWIDREDPVFVKTTVREFHISDTDDNGKTIVSKQYSDGFGRLIQTRTQCEEVIFGDQTFGDSGLPLSQTTGADAIGIENEDEENINVIVSGWQVYNNKGAVVEKYEPYYDKGFDFKADFISLAKRNYLNFPGDGIVEFADKPQYHFGAENFGMEAWIRNPGVSFQTIINNFNDDGGYSGFDFFFYEGKIYLDLADYESIIEIQTVGNYSFNVWTHIAVQKTGYNWNDFKFYINGEEVAVETGYYPGPLSTGNINAGPVTNMCIGGRLAISGDHFSGNIKQAKLYNRALSAVEVKQNFLVGLEGTAAITQGLVLYTPLTEGAGKTIRDYSVYKETGTAGVNFTWSSERISKKVQMFYDPRGQVIRTKNPDGTEQRVIFGIPYDIESPPFQGGVAEGRGGSASLNGTPGKYNPTPWESYTYDSNDLAPLITSNSETIPVDSVPEEHFYTPASSLIDPLGRTIKTIDRLTSSTDEGEQVVMQYEFDIRGNLLTVTDALGRTTFEHKYDLANRPLKTTHIDGGDKYVFMNCMNMPLELRDAKGALVLNSYDILNRPKNVWARDNGYLDEFDEFIEEVTIRQRIIYGDDAGLTDPQDQNLKGKPYKVYDEAGLTRISSYDFKGNPPEKIRQVISDTTIMTYLNDVIASESEAIPPFRVDWETMDDDILAEEEYITSMEYDALNRIKQMTYPEDVLEERKILVPTYNRAGALTKVELGTSLESLSTYVERIAYNAKGQRILIAFGNGIMTRYRYDENSFRLSRMKTEGYVIASDSEAISYQPQSGTIKQNLAYEYDLAGNIININDQTTGCGVANANSLDRDFSYDPLYRLLSANGRETAATETLPWDDTYRPENATLSRAYTQNYEYDKLGNIQELQHIASSGNFTRTFNYVSGKNKLEDIGIGASTYSFTHDVNGNITSDDTTRFYEFDYADRLRSFRVQAGTSEPTQYAHYLYDGGGNRVKKIVRKQSGGYRSTVYIDGIFEHTKASSYSDAIPNLEIGEWLIGGEEGEQNTLHIMDDKSRIATIRVGDALDDSTPEIKYIIDDHLGSSSILVDENGTLVSKEEYYPFGETSFGSYGKKRYRFCGKEKDEESGLYYYGMRYYSPWTCRFVSVDPLAEKYPFYTPYQYAGNKPINASDLDGAEEDPKTPTKGQADNITIQDDKYTKDDIGKPIDHNGVKYKITGVNERTRHYYIDSSGRRRYKDVLMKDKDLNKRAAVKNIPEPKEGNDVDYDTETAPMPGMNSKDKRTYGQGGAKIKFRIHTEVVTDVTLEKVQEKKEPVEEGMKISVEYETISSMNFILDKGTAKQSRKDLQRIVKILKQNPEYIVEVSGVINLGSATYTEAKLKSDPKKSSHYIEYDNNTDKNTKRTMTLWDGMEFQADKMIKYLKKKGIDSTRMKFVRDANTNQGYQGGYVIFKKKN